MLFQQYSCFSNSRHVLVFPSQTNPLVLSWLREGSVVERRRWPLASKIRLILVQGLQGRVCRTPASLSRNLTRVYIQPARASIRSDPSIRPARVYIQPARASSRSDPSIRLARVYTQPARASSRSDPSIRLARPARFLDPHGSVYTTHWGLHAVRSGIVVRDTLCCLYSISTSVRIRRLNIRWIYLVKSRGGSCFLHDHGCIPSYPPSQIGILLFSFFLSIHYITDQLLWGRWPLHVLEYRLYRHVHGLVAVFRAETPPTAASWYKRPSQGARRRRGSSFSVWTMRPSTTVWSYEFQTEDAHPLYLSYLLYLLV